MEVRKHNGLGCLTGRWPLDTDRATIVFIHGAGGCGTFWQAQVEGLSGRVNTLAVDLPGHGASDGQGRDTIEGYARSMTRFIKGLAVPNPVACGLSMGGAIALRLLLDCPDLFKAGILLSTGARLKVAPAIFEVLARDYNKYLEMFCALVASPKTDLKIVNRWREQTASCRPEVTLGDFQACNRFDVMDDLGAIKQPVLVVSAEDDQLTPVKYADFLKHNIPGASGVHIPGAGHILPMEKPQAFNEALEEFLDREGL